MRVAVKATPTLLRAFTWMFVALTTLVSCASQEVAIEQRLSRERRLRCELRLQAGGPFTVSGESCDEFRAATFAQENAARKKAGNVATSRSRR